jgi:adenylate kinase
MPDDNRPATKQDLHNLRDEIRSEIRDQNHQLRDELVERMRDMQTEVLRAFHDWARPIEIKLRTLPMIDERLGLLEERISRIERGDPPPQTRT